MKLVGAAATVLAIPMLLIVWVVGIAGQNCGQGPITVNADSVPTSLGSYSHAQLLNAATTINVGAGHQAPPEAQTIGLMVAITDSGLDEPLVDADDFYAQLLDVDDWKGLEPSVAANTVLGGEDPYLYEDAYDDASQIIAGLGGAAYCAAGPPGSVNSYGWSLPVAYSSVSSHYGPREVICANGFCSQGFHYGVDLVAPRDTPIYAAASGVVVRAGAGGTYGHVIMIDHGGGIVTVYAHMYADGIAVTAGQQVAAGQIIGGVGCDGVCTGDHLHFETRINGTIVDPVPFMAARGYVIE